MLSYIAAVVAGLAILIWSADKFVEGAAAMARLLGVSIMIIGITIVGFGTSAPEIVVSIIAVLDNTPDLAIGNALGSNIANIGLILGVTAMMVPIPVVTRLLKSEYPLLLLATAVMAWALFDLSLDIVDGFVLIGLLVLCLGYLIREHRRHPGEYAQEENESAEMVHEMKMPVPVSDPARAMRIRILTTEKSVFSIGTQTVRRRPVKTASWRANTLQAMVDAQVGWVPTLTIYEATRDITRAANQPWFTDYLHPTMENYFRPDLSNHGSFYLEWTTEDEIEWKNNYQLWFAALRDYARRGGIIGAGEDAGFIYRMFGTGLIRELELQQEAGFHPLDVVKHATGNNAKLLGAEDEIGRIKAGYKADLILVHTNPLANFKVLYPVPTNIPTADGYEVGGMVEWTIKDGYVYSGPRLRDEVKEIVKEARANIARR